MESIPPQLVDPNKQVFPTIPGTNKEMFVESTKAENSDSDFTLSSPDEPRLELPFLIGAKLRSEVTDIDKQHIGSRTLTKTRLKSYQMKRSKLQQIGSRPGKDELSLQETSALNPLPFQKQNFRSSTSMKMVPLIQRYRTNNPLSLKHHVPMPLVKPKFVPCHSRQILWEQKESEHVQEECVDPEKFQKLEERKMYAMKGYKRMFAVPPHRKEYNDLHVGGKPPHLEEKSKMSEIQKRYIWQLQMQRPFDPMPLSAPSSTQIKDPALENQRAQETAPESIISVKIKKDQKVNMRDSSHVKTEPNRNVRKAEKFALDAESERGFRQKEKTSSSIARLRDNTNYSKFRSKSDISFYSINKKPKGNHNDRDVSMELHAALHARSQHNRVPIVDKRTSNIKRVVKKDSSVSQLKSKKLKDDDQGEAQIDEEEVETTQNIQVEEEQTVVEETTDVSSAQEETTDVDERPLSAMEVESPVEATPPVKRMSTPNPLKVPDLMSYIPSDRLQELEQIFKSLDNDKDGHILFRELETTLPKALTRNQKKFIKEVYEVVSSSTFFGVAEFCTVMLLCEQLQKLPSQTMQAIETVDCHSLQESINKFIIEFMKVDVDETSSIKAGSLGLILEATHGIAVGSFVLTDVLNGIGKREYDTISKLEYLVSIPYLLQYQYKQ